MQQTTFVMVYVRHAAGLEEPWERELGQFYEVWKRGVVIGRDPGCTVCLQDPEVPLMAAVVEAGSNHKLLYRAPIDASPETWRPDRHTDYDARVDYREFQLGPYWIRFDEVSRSS